MPRATRKDITVKDGEPRFRYDFTDGSAIETNESPQYIVVNAYFSKGSKPYEACYRTFTPCQGASLVLHSMGPGSTKPIKWVEGMHGKFADALPGERDQEAEKILADLYRSQFVRDGDLVLPKEILYQSLQHMLEDALNKR